MKKLREKVMVGSVGNEFPEIPMSIEIVTRMRTGNWRDSRPQYKEKIAPCNYHCPAGEDIRGYLRLTQESNYEKALELIRESNPLPSVCGRVCYHPCEQNCNRGQLDDPIAIHAIERFLSDRCAERGIPPSSNPNGKRVAVIGSGPSGLSCAYQLTRMGYSVTVFEKLPLAGGVLRYGIPEYRLPKKVLDRDINFIVNCGVAIKANTHIGKDVWFDELRENYDAIFVGIGAQGDRQLGIPGDRAECLISGMHFLTKLNCHIPFAIGRRVIVIGGGNTAIDCARSARRLGAESVQILYRRTQNEMLASAVEICQAEQEGVEFLFLTSPTEIHLQDEGFCRLKCTRMELGPLDTSGRKVAIAVPGSNFSIEADSLITALGATVDITILPSDIGFNGHLIRIHDDGQTGQARIYAGGDCVDQPRTVIHAIDAGKRAALAIDKYFGRTQIKNCTESYDVVGFNIINAAYFTIESQVREQYLPVKQRLHNFDEVNQSFSEDMAIQESKRCFSCGSCTECNVCLIFCPDIAVSKKGNAYDINYDYCKGCGICAEECPRGVLSMEIEKWSNH